MSFIYRAAVVFYRFHWRRHPTCKRLYQQQDLF